MNYIIIKTIPTKYTMSLLKMQATQCDNYLEHKQPMRPTSRLYKHPQQNNKKTISTAQKRKAK